MEENKLHFITNVQLKSIIGKDLINDDNIAILELVKNSFDANAKKVSIEFFNIKSNDDNETSSFTEKSSRIIISDDGVGMDLNSIKNKWLNIAYSEKKTNTRKYNRTMAGAKGVGRFSCDRLGEYLNLYSKTLNGKYILLKIDWKKFEIDNDVNKEIQSIELDYEILGEEDLKKRSINPFNSGVVLEIIKLRRTWSQPIIDKNRKIIDWNSSRFIELKKYMEKLINPNHAYETDDFGIFINANEFIEQNNKLQVYEKFLGPVKNQIFDKLDFKTTFIESKIIEDGKYIFTELKDKGKTIFWIKEKNEFYPLIKNAKIALYYLNPYAKAFFTKQTGIRAVDYGSIFLFINGFRIPPYGDVGNDWLGIDQRKAQGYARYIGLREYVGRIEILDSDNDFQIISSREGIVRNDNYFALTELQGNKSYFFKTLRRLEKYVVDGLNWDSIPEKDLNKISEIEKKIISGETKENELHFRENNKIKEIRTYEIIHSIVSAKPENVIELFINEDLILNKVKEEREKSEKDFEKLLKDFENNKVDDETLNKILNQKNNEIKGIDKELMGFSKFNINKETTKAIINIHEHKKNSLNQAYIIQELKEKLKKTNEDLEVEKDKNLISNQQNEELKAELKETISQNLFLRSIKSQDLEEIVSFMHHIGISTSNVENAVTGAYLKLKKDDNLDKFEIIKTLEYISNEMRKILSITRFATKANFKLFTDETEIDIFEYINEYINNIIKPMRSEELNIEIYQKKDTSYFGVFKPIEFSIIFDNLISNSHKAKAKNIKIELDSNSKELIINYSDDGNGVKKEFEKNLFEMGVTSTPGGSGLGLFHLKKIINDMGGNISLESSKPATFKITLKK